MMKLKAQPNAKLRSRNARNSTTGCGAVKARQKNTDAPHNAQYGERGNRRIVQPVVARAFLEHVLHRAEEQRHRAEPDEIEATEQRMIRLVEIDEEEHRGRDDDARHDVDEKQPMPRERVAEVAADRRADCRRERRHEADHRRHDVALGRRKERERHREHARDHAAADEALNGAVDDHLIDRRRCGAQQARKREADGRCGEQHPRRERASEKARERDHHHFRDQIRRLHPRDLVAACRQTRLDFRKRRRDDLDVQDRHEHAEHHREEACQLARRHADPGKLLRLMPHGGAPSNVVAWAMAGLPHSGD